MSKPASTRYRTLNWSSYNASLRERGSLLPGSILRRLARGALGQAGRLAGLQRSRDPGLPDEQDPFRLPLCQTTGFVASLMKLAGLEGPVPDFSTLCRRQKTLAVQLPYRGSGGPLHLLVDSTGIKVCGEGEWHACKHSGAQRRVWCNVFGLMMRRYICRRARMVFEDGSAYS